MQTTKNRRGLAIGAAVALLGTFFGGVPASYAATDGANIAVKPLSNAATTNFTGLLTEDFPVFATLLPGSGNANTNFANGKLLWTIERVSGALDVLAVTSTVSATLAGVSNDGIDDATTRASASANIVWEDGPSATVSSFVSVWAGSTSATVSGRVTTDATGYAPLFIKAASASGITSSSPDLVVKVTAFIDELGGQNGQFDDGEWFTSQTITLKGTAALAPTLSVGAPAKGDTVLTASATLAALNYSNLDGKVFLAVSTSDTTAVFTKTGATGTTVTSSALAQSAATAYAGVVSESFVTNALTESTTISMQLRYDAAGTATNIYSGVQLGSTTLTSVVSAPGVSVLTASAVVGANVAGGGQAYNVRPNQTYTIKVHAKTASSSVSGQAISVALGGIGLVTSSKEISINGGALTTVYPTALAITTGADGYASFTIRTTGFVDGNTLTVDASVGNVEAPLVTLTVADPSYTVTSDFDYYVTAPGTAVSIPFTVEDQFEEASSRTDQYLKVTRGGTGFNYATTVSYVAVVAGAANVSFTPEAATTTGSATVRVDIVRLSAGAYVADGSSNDTVNVSVTSGTDAFGTGLVASQSASISYFPSTVSWTTITGKVANTGSAVVISGDSSLVFRVSADVPATSSAALTVRAGVSGAYSFQVAALKEGDWTVTLKNGTASTTSLVVVDPAASDLGVAITFDTTTIAAGKTKIVTGTLVDANGNPVDTTNAGSTAGDAGTASILVTFAGTAGIPVGAMPTETDADGHFQVSVLTSAQDSGTFTLTATYLAQGASTATADKVTSVATITVGAAAPAASSDAKVNAGSFKGYVALYAKGYEGQKMTAKVAGKWLKVDSLASGFERVVRYTGAGYDIVVEIYIDGELEGTFNLTTK